MGDFSFLHKMIDCEMVIEEEISTTGNVSAAVAGLQKLRRYLLARDVEYNKNLRSGEDLFVCILK